MTTPSTASHRSALRLPVILAWTSLVLGLVLLVYMVRAESEPGALPLLLVLLGVGGLVWTRRRARS